jgi:hypothetical protein
MYFLEIPHMFKTRFVLPLFAAAIVCSASAIAQAPAGAPAGANGTCKDGTYSMNPTKSGACSGHKGVATWFGPTTAKGAATSKTTAPAATPAPAAAMTPKPAPAAAMTPKPAPAAAPAPAPSTAMTAKTPSNSAAALAAKPAAAGGGPGMVWVNSASKVYHCPTDRYYGKTKAGKYLSEQAAIAEGDKADAGKKCF